MSERATAPISVVITAHDSEEFLRDTLQSVFDQTLAAAEVLVVDDGSTDRSAELAEAMGARIIRQANAGVSAARNAGVRAAVQPWIAFLDDDDLWEPEKLDVQWRALEMAPEAGAVFSDHATFDETGLRKPAVLRGRPTYRRIAREPLGRDVYRLDQGDLGRALCRGNLLKPSTLVARRELLLEIGGFDPAIGAPGSIVGQTEDRDLSLRLAPRTTVIVVERPLVRYRRHGGGASTDRIRVAMGAAEIGRRVREHPERYPPEARAYYRRDRPVQLRAAGVMLMEEGRFREARAALATSLSERPALRTAGALGVALLGAPAHRALLAAKRKLGLPGLRGGGGA
jgi:glycosyltransferase involved in cell wall biosynthesis